MNRNDFINNALGIFRQYISFIVIYSALSWLFLGYSGVIPRSAYFLHLLAAGLLSTTHILLINIRELVINRKYLLSTARIGVVLVYAIFFWQIWSCFYDWDIRSQALEKIIYESTPD